MRLGDITLKDQPFKFSWGENTMMGPTPKLIYTDGVNRHITIPADDNFMMARFAHCDANGLDHEANDLQVPSDDFTFDGWHYTANQGGSTFLGASGAVELNELDQQGADDWARCVRQLGRSLGRPA
jgi:hypothetical protein